MFGIFGEKAPLEDAPEEEGVVTPEKVELSSEKNAEEEPELSLVEDQLEGGDPYNTADKMSDVPDELKSERAANQELKKTIEDEEDQSEAA